MTGPARIDRLTRKPDRGSSSRARLDALLDEALVGTLVAVDEGHPWVVPMLFARVGDRVLMHGSTGAGTLRLAAAGAEAALSVTLLDGIVVAASTFESSANYRSAVLRGTLGVLTGDDAWQALDAISDRLVPGRTAEVRPMTPKEVAATVVLALPVVDGSWTYKERIGPPAEPEPGDDPRPWTGVVPLRTVAGPEQPAPGTPPGLPVPASVSAVVSRWPSSR